MTSPYMSWPVLIFCVWGKMIKHDWRCANRSQISLGTSYILFKLYCQDLSTSCLRSVLTADRCKHTPICQMSSCLRPISWHVPNTYTSNMLSYICVDIDTCQTHTQAICHCQVVWGLLADACQTHVNMLDVKIWHNSCRLVVMHTYGCWQTISHCCTGSAPSHVNKRHAWLFRLRFW